MPQVKLHQYENRLKQIILISNGESELLTFCCVQNGHIFKIAFLDVQTLSFHALDQCPTCEKSK